MIFTQIVKKTDLQAFLATLSANTSDELTTNEFPIFKFNEQRVKDKLTDYLEDIKDSVYCFIEYPYVDKLYRDSYYHFFSSRHQTYLRNTIRVSFFAENITPESFRDTKLIESIREQYLGFVVLRPTPPCIIGRSMISPKALKTNSFLCCLCESNVVVNGIKFSISAFPHSSQDTETITCAETSVWSCMEYFGNKYSEYKTILPSSINTAIKEMTSERLLPSRGLTIGWISYALKTFGFGTRIYSRDACPDKKEFQRVLNYYVESGIPLVVSLTKQGAAHAVLFVGHEDNLQNNVFIEDNVLLKSANNLLKQISGSIGLNVSNNIIDSADIPRKYVLIDDNTSPLKVCSFDCPEHYKGTNLDNMNVTAFVVPLYSKIYMEATVARDTIRSVLNDKRIFGYNSTKDGSVLIYRLFLTSSRSYKKYVAVNDMNRDVKDLLINSDMPKFIWVAELSNETQYKNSKAIGLILLDATSNNFENVTNSIVLYPGVLKYETIPYKQFEMTEFDIYSNNLRGGKQGWKLD